MMHARAHEQMHGRGGMLRAMAQRLQAHARNEDGAAAVEFTLLLPFLVLLMVGATEMFLMSMASRKMTRVTNTVGDLITQAKGTLRQQDIRNYYQAAKIIMGKFPEDKLALSVFTYTMDRRRNRPRLAWRMHLGKYTCKGGIPQLTADQKVAMRDGNDLVITYGCYRYQVKIGRFALGDRTIRMTDEVTLRPRQQLRVVCTDCSS